MLSFGQYMLLGLFIFVLTWASEMVVRVIWAYVSKRQAEKKVEQMKAALNVFNKENKE